MSYTPNTIILMSFGKYARDKERKMKRYLPSITQIPLICYRGFSYINRYLSNPEETNPIVIEPDDLEHIQIVADVLGKFPVKVKCEGEDDGCDKQAKHLILPYSIDRNADEKIMTGGPVWIKQIHLVDSSFYCGDCADEKKYEKENKVIELDISLRLPDFFTDFKQSREWNLDRTGLHKKLKKIAYQLTTKGIDDVIDPRTIADEKAIMTRYAAKKIVNKMLRIPEDQSPKNSKEFKIERLKWSRSDVDKRGQLFLDFHAPPSH